MTRKCCAAALAVAGMLAPICSWAQPAMHADYRIVDRIPGADGGWDFASVDPAAGRLYVARSNGIMAVDLSDRKVTAALAPAHRAHAVLPMPGTREIVETDGETGLTRFIDGATGAVTAEVATGAKPDAAFLDPATGLVAVMNAGDGTIALVDPVRHALAGKIQVGGGLEFGVADGKGLGYVNIEDRNAIAVVDLKARRVLKSIALPGCEGPTGLALVANGTRLISACANKVAMIVDVAAAKVAGSFAIGSDPDAVLVDPARGLAFIPCGGTGTLEVVDIGDARHIRHAGTIQTQVGAKTGAIDPRNGRIYLPAATLAAPEAGAKRGKPVPGSFVVLVLAPVRS